MKFFIVFASFLAVSSVSGYGGGSKSAASTGGYGGSGGYGSGGGFGMGSGRSLPGSSIAGQIIPIAIQTAHQIEFRDVPSTGSVTPAVIEVGSQSLPVMILFRSSSSTLNVQQMHDSAQGSVQESSSEDEPHRLVHSVTKPVIQEVHEVITPFRKITQEIQPVQEEIQTIVARNVGQPGLASGFGGAISAGAGLGANFNVGGLSISGFGGASGGNKGGLGSGLKTKSASSYAAAASSPTITSTKSSSSSSSSSPSSSSSQSKTY